MKIKHTFITNSSSTAYLIFIPDSFKIDHDEIENVVRFEILDLIHPKMRPVDDMVDQIIDDIETELEQLRNGEQYTHYDFSEEELVFWRSILTICEKNNLIMSDIDLPTDGGDYLIGITKEVLMDTLVSHIDLDEFMKPFLKEKRNDPKATK
jgi:hypothetical protein